MCVSMYIFLCVIHSACVCVYCVCVFVCVDVSMMVCVCLCRCGGGGGVLLSTYVLKPMILYILRLNVK